MTQRFQAVNRQQEDEQYARRAAQPFADDKRHSEHGMGFQPGQRQSGHAHHHGENRNGKMFEPVRGDDFLIGDGGGSGIHAGTCVI